MPVSLLSPSFTVFPGRLSSVSLVTHAGINNRCAEQRNTVRGSAQLSPLCELRNLGEEGNARGYRRVACHVDA